MPAASGAAPAWRGCRSMTRWRTATRKAEDEKATPAFGFDTIEMAMRARVRETIEAIVEEELEAALGARKSARVGDTRQGYRHATPRADADDQPGADDDRDAAGASPAAPTGRAASGVARLIRALSAPDSARRRSHSRHVSGGHEYAPDQRALAPLLRVARCRRMRCRGSWAGLREDFDTWRTAIWPMRTFATCSWTAGIPRCASADGASVSRCS